jgi:hypothetical protein
MVSGLVHMLDVVMSGITMKTMNPSTSAMNKGSHVKPSTSAILATLLKTLGNALSDYPPIS